MRDLCALLHIVYFGTVKPPTQETDKTATQSPLHLLPARSHRHGTEGERGKGMELRSCGTAPAASMVSSPQPTPPRTRPRKQGAEKGPRRAAAETQPALSKRARCGQQRVGSRAAGAGLQPCRFEPDAWTEVAKHLHVTDLWSLSATCRWFRRLLSDDSIWRHAFLRDLSLSTDDPNMLRILHVPRPLHRSWRRLYATALDPTQSYCFRRPEKHIESFRIGGFLMDTSKLLLTAKLALPPMPMLDDCPDTSTGACLLTNVRPGIWIADMHMLRCPVCDHHKCQGDDARLEIVLGPGIVSEFGLDWNNLCGTYRDDAGSGCPALRAVPGEQVHGRDLGVRGARQPLERRAGRHRRRRHLQPQPRRYPRRQKYSQCQVLDPGPLQPAAQGAPHPVRRRPQHQPHAQRRAVVEVPGDAGHGGGGRADRVGQDHAAAPVIRARFASFLSVEVPWSNSNAPTHFVP